MSFKIIVILGLQFSLVAVLFLGPFFERQRPDLYSLSFYFTLVFLLLNAAFATYSVIIMKHSFQVRPQPTQKGKLIKAWPFSITRNPIYLAILLSGISWCLFNQSLIATVALLLLFIVLKVKIRLEESFLLEKYKTEYSSYKKQVPQIFPLLKK